jgi:uncharacterized membrane-anchored protein
MYAARHRASKSRAACGILAVGAGLLLLLAPADANAQQQKKPAPPQIQWQDGPTQADLGTVAQIQVPNGFKFTGIDGTRKFEELLQNPVGGKEVGVIIPDLEGKEDATGFWFILFEFDPIGYVKDGDQKDLNDQTITTILNSIRAGTEAANQERQRRGWPTMSVVGWERQPFYDPATHNLVWGIRGSSQEEGKPSFSINYNTRILGRKGVLSANLVVDPDKLNAVVPTYQKLVSGVSFKQGESYAEMRAGDKIAEYGLIGLITGGVGAVALKTGFFTKFLKPILLGIVAVFVTVGKAFKSFFGKLTGSAAK